MSFVLLWVSAALTARAQDAIASTHGSVIVTEMDSEVPDPAEPGWSLALITNLAYDSRSGESTLETPSIAVRLNRVFSADASVPYYTHVNAESADATERTGKAILASHEGVLGDAAIAAHATLNRGHLEYTATTAFTVPTGDAHLGLSSGHLGYELNNHLERAWRRYTPAFEAGVSSTSALIRRGTRKTYVSNGLLGFLQVGSSVELPHRFDVNLAGYEQFPLGGQTVYNRIERKNSFVLLDRGDAEDNGASLEVQAPATGLFELGVSYSRSIRQNTGTISVSIALLLHGETARH